jgi:hypothetical protein
LRQAEKKKRDKVDERRNKINPENETFGQVQKATQRGSQQERNVHRSYLTSNDKAEG